jgi:hypothetical protein
MFNIDLAIKFLTESGSTHGTSADQYQLARSGCLVMVCTVCYLGSTYFEIFSKYNEWFYDFYHCHMIERGLYVKSGAS